MYSGRIIFPQLMSFLPKHEFNKCVHRYRGEYWIRSFSCFDQFLCMAFAQLTYRESLRDIETCLRAMQPKLYHAGIRGRVSRSTLADANEKRDWRIYADFAHVLIGMARELYADEDFGLQLNQTAYALDSTTIDLCLSLFPWASFRQHKGAIKLHTEMDLRGSIPSRLSTGSPMGRFTMSPSWISWYSNQLRSTSWTVDTSILLASIGSHNTWRFL